MRSLVTALALTLAAPALAVDVSGVRVPDTVTVEGKELRHNGSGIRKRFVVKVYLGSLYLATPSKSADEIIASDEAKSVRLYFMRDVSKGQVLDAFRDGFRNNSPGEADALQKKLDRLSRALPDELKEHSLLTVSWAPGTGTIVSADGGSPVIIEGKEFNDALMRNWLGPKPADGDLKKRMLGG